MAVILFRPQCAGAVNDMKSHIGFSKSTFNHAMETKTSHQQYQYEIDTAKNW